MAKSTNKVGHPPKYKKEYCQVAIDLGMQGRGRAHVARKLEVSVTTLRSWEKEYSEFLTAMERNYDLCEAWWADHAINRAPESDKMIMFMLQHKFKYNSNSVEMPTTDVVEDINFNDVTPEFDGD